MGSPGWWSAPAIRALGSGGCPTAVALLLCARPLHPLILRGPPRCAEKRAEVRAGTAAQPVWDGAHPEPRCWWLRAWLFPTARGGQCWGAGRVLRESPAGVPPSILAASPPGPSPKTAGGALTWHHIDPSHTWAPPPGHLPRGRNRPVPWSQPVCGYL